MRVLLPDPLGPIKPMMAGPLKAKLTSVMALTFPNRLERLRAAIVNGFFGGAPVAQDLWG